jgi:NADPH-dependent 7-cyano-7-deazaguanine reductase QueF
MLALGTPTQEDVKDVMEKVLALLRKIERKTKFRKINATFEAYINTFFKVIIAHTQKSLLSGYKQFTSRLQQSH